MKRFPVLAVAFALVVIGMSGAAYGCGTACNSPNCEQQNTQTACRLNDQKPKSASTNASCPSYAISFLRALVFLGGIL
jgi:hypothetical protein